MIKTSYIYKFLLRVFIIFLLNILVISIVTQKPPHQLFYQKNNQTINVLSKQGSKGDEVRRIQTKLSQLGLYSGAIDGIFGAKTKSAVITFQKQKGLTADGIAGEKTLKALGLSQSSGNGQYSNSDIDLLARTISAEARGESYTGQVAVGAVILNRIEHPSFPDSLSGVIYQPGAFSCLNDGQFYQNVSESAMRAAQDALNGWDPSGGAIYYYNPVKSTNKWIFSRPVITVIGNHRFCS